MFKFLIKKIDTDIENRLDITEEPITNISIKSSFRLKSSILNCEINEINDINKIIEENNKVIKNIKSYKIY
jgi:hypothetical protein